MRVADESGGGGRWGIGQGRRRGRGGNTCGFCVKVVVVGRGEAGG